MLIVLTFSFGEFMSEDKRDKGLRNKLILVGLKELEEHGIKDFSLRRVAVSADVSCAAPYRHFKNKDQLIKAILEYIRDDWFILCEQIGLVFMDNTKDLIKELCISCIKFWIANGNFLSVLFLIQSSTNGEIKDVLRDFDKPILNKLEQFSHDNSLENQKIAELQHTIPSLIYGSLMMISKNDKLTEEIIHNTSNVVCNLLSI